MSTVDGYEAELRNALTCDLLYSKWSERMAGGLSERDRMTLRTIAAGAALPRSADEFKIGPSVNLVKLELYRVSGHRAALLLARNGDPEGIRLLLEWWNPESEVYWQMRKDFEHALMEGFENNLASGQQVIAADLFETLIGQLTATEPADITEKHTDMLISAFRYLASIPDKPHRDFLTRGATLAPRGRNRILVCQTASALLLELRVV